MAEPGQSRPAPAPSEADELARLRREIDAVDRALLDRLNERARLVQAVGRLKRAHGFGVYDGDREREIVARLRAGNAGPFPDAGIAPVFREIVSATRSLEAAVRVAFLGPEGTFSHEAARRRFGALASLRGAASLGEIFAVVERGKADLGVVPVENTTEGVVTQTLDAFVDSPVSICGEVFLRISHQLLSKSGRLGDVRRIASHPQPLAQCRQWLDRHLPDRPRVETPSTAAAAALAAEDGEVAAIGSAIAGEVYALRPIESAIEDRDDNTTRFWVIGEASPPPSGNDLTTVMFTTRRDESGALHRLLAPFASHGINLTSIQARPLAGKPWEYVFFLDLEGHASEARVARALADAARAAHSHRVLGSFPRGEREGRRAS